MHGFPGQDKRGIIMVSARGEEDFLILSVCDNGAGADTEYLNGVLSGEYTVSDKGPMHSGYGIVNVDERLKLAFGPKSGLFYTENPDGEGITAEIRMEQKLSEGGGAGLWMRL
jgi:two-component system sensor histidine kinase YesM